MGEPVDRPEAVASAPWRELLCQGRRRRIAVVGGAGRLGTRLSRLLAAAGHRVLVLDRYAPMGVRDIAYAQMELERASAPALARALRGCEAVVHLAAMHGAHLAEGFPRRRLWEMNVRGTDVLLAACVRAGVRRVVFASSTAVYGDGSPEGEPARILTERTPVDPADVYDLSKLAGEQLLRASDVEGVVLRFGRFFFPSQAGYHLRKLSTGLDVKDACQAVVRSLVSAREGDACYCVASDLRLTDAQRRRLGIDAPAVLEQALPGFVAIARERGIEVPPRVGKSVDTTAFRAQLGYAPEHCLQATYAAWERPPRRARSRQLPHPDALFGLPRRAGAC